MSDTTFPRTFPFDRLQATSASSPRRTNHGSGGWAMPSSFGNLRQPQDGALTNGVTNSSVVLPMDVTAPVVEAEDAGLNGTLRSLARRVKGLNVTSARAAIATGNSQAASPPLFRNAPESNRKPSRTQVA